MNGEYLESAECGGKGEVQVSSSRQGKGLSCCHLEGHASVLGHKQTGESLMRIFIFIYL